MKRLLLLLVFALTLALFAEDAKKVKKQGEVIEVRGRLWIVGKNMTLRGEDGVDYKITAGKDKKPHLRKLKDLDVIIKGKVIENKNGKVIKELIEVQKIPEVN